MSDTSMAPRNNYFLDKSRVVAHFDIDCFSCQVALKHMPDLKGKPFATFDRKKRIVSVSYEAKSYGVVKGMKCHEAFKKCPQLVTVDKNKVGRDKFLQASDQLFEAVKSFCDKSMTIEKTSTDDFYIDLTDKCDQYVKDKYKFDKQFLKGLQVKVEGGNRQYMFGENRYLMTTYWSEAAVYVADMIDHIYNKTGLRCSVGISVNKALARFGCRLNKPNAITIIESKAGISRISDKIPIEWVYGLGGETGKFIKKMLNVATLKDLRQFRRQDLMAISRRSFEGQPLGAFLFDICRGIDYKPVLHRPDYHPLDVNCTSRIGLKTNSHETIDLLYDKCKIFVNKLNKDLNENRRIAHRIRVEVITKIGQNLSTNLFVMSKTYETDQIFEQIVAKGFPYISSQVPKVIKQFRLIAFDFKQLCTQPNDPMFGLEQQMKELSI